MKRIISFSLWGQNLKYLVGAVRNADLAKEIYPGWICRFFIGASVPSGFVTQLKEKDNTEIVMMPDWGDWKALFWRFSPASDPDTEIMISRDTDSRLSWREKEAVEEWIKSEKGFHIMRDHPYHRFLVLGGMWGVRAGTLENIEKLIKNFQVVDEYGTDYQFWQKVGLHDIAKDDIMVHDEFFSDNKPFPSPRRGLDFVGKVFDENEDTVDAHEQILKDYILKNNKE